MKTTFYWAYTTRSLRRGGQRTVLAAFCIAVGVMAIVALQLASTMVSNDLTGNVRTANGGDVSVHQDVVPLQPADLAYFDSLKRHGATTGVTGVTALTRDRGTVRAPHDGTHVYPSVIGIVDPASYPLVGEPDFVRPANGNLHRLLARSDAVVLSSVAASAARVTVGDRVTVSGSAGRNVTARVVGIVGAGGLASGYDAYVRRSDWVRSTTAQNTIFAPNARQLTYNVVYLTTTTADRATALAASIRKRYPLATVETVADALKARQDDATHIHQLLQVVGILALLIGGFGVVNTMNVLLARRRTEIAMLKTAGYRRRDLYLLFGLEALLLGLVGGLVGAALGVGLSYAVKTLLQNAFPILQDLPFAVDAPTILAGIGVGVATALIFGLQPIVRAAFIRPQAVLRDLPERRDVIARVALSAVLLLLLSVLFCVLAVAILGDLTWGVVVVYGAFAVLGALGLLFGAVLWGIGRLPVPERLGPLHAAFAGLALLAALGVAVVLPTVGVLLALLVLALGFGAALAPHGWKATIKMALRDVGRGRARATMTLLSLFVGVFGVGLIVILGQDVRDHISDVLANGTGYNVVSVVPVRYDGQVRRRLRTLPGLRRYAVLPAVQDYPLAINGRATTDIIARVRAEGKARPGTGNLGVSGFVSFLYGFGGYDLAHGQSTQAVIKPGYGRDLTAADANSNNVLLDSVLHDFGPVRLKVGDRITVQTIPALGGSGDATPRTATVRVVGFYNTGPLGDTTHIEPILASRRFVQRFGGDNRQFIYSIQVDGRRTDTAVADLDEHAPRALTINLTSLGALIDQILGNLVILLVALASLALFAGVIIIANAVALAMLERRREQGILKAVGYTSGRVLAGVLIENGLIGGLGGICGMIVAAIATTVLAHTLFHISLAVPGLTALALILLVTVVALVTAGLVSWRAVRVRPIEVLRYE